MLKYAKNASPASCARCSVTPSLRVRGQQPVRVVHHARHEVARHVDQVELAAAEREQARIRLLDHRDLDASDLRQALALHRGVRGARVGVGVRGQRGKRLLAVVRVGLEHDALRAPPLDEPERAGADRIGHRPAAGIAVLLDHLARDGGGLRRRQDRQERVVGLGQLELQRVAVERAQPLDLRVVVEPAGRLRLRDRVVEPRQPPAQQERVGRAHLRVDEALHRVDEVVRGELALRPLEHRVVGEVDALADADLPDEAVGRDLRHAVRHARHDPVRTREVVVLVERIEDRRVDRVGVEVRGGLRVEAGLRDDDRRAQHLRGIAPLRGALRVRGGRERCGEQRGERRGAERLHCTALRGTPRSMSRYCHGFWLNGLYLKPTTHG